MKQRIINYHIYENGEISPAIPQHGGVKGEERMTAVSFVSSAALFSDVNAVRLSFRGGDGTVLSSDLLSPQVDEATNHAGVSYCLPKTVTMLGGQVEIRLILSHIDENGTETVTFQSGAAVLYFEDAAVENGTPFWTGVSELLKGTVSASQEARLARDAAEAATELAAEHLEEAIGACDDAKGHATSAFGYARTAQVQAQNADAARQAAEDARDKAQEIAGIVADDGIPDYWDEHLAEKIAAIKALQDEGGKDCFSFVVMADMHYEQNLGKRAPHLAKRILDECGIKYALVLGDCGTRNGILKDLDYIDGEWDDIEGMLAPIRDHLLITDGNHDGSYGATDGDGDGVIDDVHGTGNSAINFTPQKKYSVIKRKVGLLDGVTFDKSGCGYYADDKAAKVRYIVLSTHNNKYDENEDGSSKYSNMVNFRYGQSQFDLVVNALTTLEEGWSVLVASHVPLDRSGELLHWGATEMEDNRLVSGEVECWVLADVLNAFVNKTAYTGSFTGTQGAVATYKNLADKTSADWLTGYRTSSSGVSAESGFDVTNFIGDGVTPVGDMTLYFKNATLSNQRIYFYNANKEAVYNAYPTTFEDKEGFDETATEGRLFIDKEKNEALSSAVYVRLCLVSGDTTPIITLDEPIEASGDAFDAVSVDVDFADAKGVLIGYFGGHVHKDNAWGTTYDWNGRLKRCDFQTITTRCDSANENDSTLLAERVAGTVTEQSFDVFTVNTATHTITATKIGAGDDRVITY